MYIYVQLFVIIVKYNFQLGLDLVYQPGVDVISQNC